MLLGTLVGVLVIPGLFFLLAKLSGNRKLIADEDDEPLSEIAEHQNS
jgi:HAE1 family hydrophobic/amphiphilic exporter-1